MELDLSLLVRGADGFVALAFLAWSSISVSVLLWIHLEESAHARAAERADDARAAFSKLPAYSPAE
jgi:hypothetical protein